MQQWEYLELYISGNQWADSWGRSGHVPVANPPSMPQYRTAAAVMNDLGAEGWEVSGIVPGTDTEYYKVLFKRPKQLHPQLSSATPR